jgi:hypothetical protein
MVRATVVVQAAARAVVRAGHGLGWAWAGAPGDGDDAGDGDGGVRATVLVPAV